MTDGHRVPITSLDVETHEGRVVAVWFKHQPLPFRVWEVQKQEADELDKAYADEDGDGVELAIEKVVMKST